MSEEQTVWVSEGECCDECGWLLGYFGECTNPACPLWESWNGWDEDEDDIYDDAQKRVHDLFYQKLAAKHPDSPWLKVKEPQDDHLDEA